MIRFKHTNIIAKNATTLIEFYKNALDCRSVGETRDLSGDWLDRLSGIKDAHLIGEHLLLPGYSEHAPTLEIFTYDAVQPGAAGVVNAAGFAHIAFEVDSVPEALARVLSSGGGIVGETVRATYANGRTIEVVYATDPEGNIIELQGWL